MPMSNPKISIIIPTLNEEKHIGRCLDSILGQTYGGELEIIVADGGSTDKTLEIINKYCGSHPNIKLIDNPGKYQAAGRNRAIMESTSDLIAYIDAHSYAEKDWLEQLYNSYAELEAATDRLAGIGSVYFDASQTAFSLASDAALRSILSGAGRGHFLNADGITEVDNAYGCLYSKAVLMEAGLYSEYLIAGEDMELNRRITGKLGYKLYVNPRARTYYYRKKTALELFRQQSCYGFWRVKAMMMLSSVSLKVFIPALFVIVVEFLGFCSMFSLAAFYAFLFVLAVYAGVILSFSIGLSIIKRVSLIKLLIIFPCIHFGYGAGVIAGLFKSGQGINS